MNHYLDTRDLAERIVELTDERAAYAKSNAKPKATKKALATLRAEWDETTSEGDELAALVELRESLGRAWERTSLIPEREFEDYARQTAEDIGAIEKADEWPCCHIDWSCAADSLKQDYSRITYRGDEYLYRE